MTLTSLDGKNGNLHLFKLNPIHIRQKTQQSENRSHRHIMNGVVSYGTFYKIVVRL